MVEKRFTLRYDEKYVDSEYDNIIEDNSEVLTQNEVVDLLNELHKENKQLKKENQRLGKQKNVLINHMNSWCPKRFYDGIIKQMEEVE